MLAVLINTLESTPSEWVDHCIDSVRSAARRARYPIEIGVIASEPGHVGMARMQALALGADARRHSHFCFVDDDDWLAPEAFDCLEPWLDSSMRAIYTREYIVGARGQCIPADHRHHLAVYRLDAVEGFPFGHWPGTPDLALMHWVGERNVVDLPDRVYYWRQRIDSAGRAARIAQRRDLH